MEHTTQDFDGVFRFTNATNEDFKALWNNKEYVFKAGTCSPMIISGETDEARQEIRKKFAYKLALREFYKSNDYMHMKDQGQGLPPTYDESILNPWIQQCLEKLPESRAEVTEVKTEPIKLKAFKPVKDKVSLNEQFKDDIEE